MHWIKLKKLFVVNDVAKRRMVLKKPVLKKRGPAENPKTLEFTNIVYTNLSTVL